MDGWWMMIVLVKPIYNLDLWLVKSHIMALHCMKKLVKLSIFYGNICRKKRFTVGMHCFFEDRKTITLWGEYLRRTKTIGQESSSRGELQPWFLWRHHYMIHSFTNSSGCVFLQYILGMSRKATSGAQLHSSLDIEHAGRSFWPFSSRTEDKDKFLQQSAEIADESHLILCVHLFVRILCFQLLQFEDMHRLRVTGCTEELAFRTEGQRTDTDIPADTNPTWTKGICITTKQFYSLNVSGGFMYGRSDIVCSNLFMPRRNSNRRRPSGMENTRMTVPCEGKKPNGSGGFITL